MSHEYGAVEEGETKEDRKRRCQRVAREQLYNEGEIGFEGTDDGLRKQRTEISQRAQEIEERELFEELRKKYGS